MCDSCVGVCRCRERERKRKRERDSTCVNVRKKERLVYDCAREEKERRVNVAGGS